MAEKGLTKSEYVRLASDYTKRTRTDDNKFSVPYKTSTASKRNKTYAKKIKNGEIREF